MGNIDQRVKRIVAQQLGFDEENIKNECYLVKDLGADSLAVMELLMALEEELNYTIADEEVEKIRTVEQIITNVRAHLKLDTRKRRDLTTFGLRER